MIPVRLRWLKTAAVAVAAVALLIAISYFAVPPLAKHLLVDRLSESLRRPVAVREIRFNPLQLRLTVSGFTTGEREGRGEFFAFDELFVDLETISIFRRLSPITVVSLEVSGGDFEGTVWAALMEAESIILNGGDLTRAKDIGEKLGEGRLNN